MTPYRLIQQERINGWNVMSGQSNHTGRWSAWAKKEPFAGESPLAEIGSEVFLEFGDSRQQAINNLAVSDLRVVNHDD